jgi:hypothetical protein
MLHFVQMMRNATEIHIGNPLALALALTCDLSHVPTKVLRLSGSMRPWAHLKASPEWILENAAEGPLFGLHVGIGDALLTKLAYDGHKLQGPLVVDLQSTRQLRNNDLRFERFLILLLEHLFVDIRIQCGGPGPLPAKTFPLSIYSLPVFSLAQYFDTRPLIQGPYLVFHTKYRSDTHGFMQENGGAMIGFFESFRCKHPIVLLGEKAASRNYESAVLDIDCLYPLMVRLGKHNSVLDLTVAEIGNTPDLALFRRDVRVIHNATTNVGYGVGGNMILAAVFGRGLEFFPGRYGAEGTVRHTIDAFEQSFLRNGVAERFHFASTAEQLSARCHAAFGEHA